MPAFIPVAKIVTLPGDVITVQLRPVPATTNEVQLHIQRNANREERFTLEEFRQVVAIITRLAAEAQARTLATAKVES